MLLYLVLLLLIHTYAIDPQILILLLLFQLLEHTFLIIIFHLARSPYCFFRYAVFGDLSFGEAKPFHFLYDHIGDDLSQIISFVPINGMHSAT